jgi:hypothetical protein
MKIIRYFVVVLGAYLLLRLGACTTGLSPRPEPGFTPEGQRLTPSEGLRPETQVSPSAPERARDAALELALEVNPQIADGAEDPQQVSWEVEDRTPAGLLGSVTVVFSGGGWEISVSYPVAAPGNEVYQVRVVNLNSGLSWEGRLDAGFRLIPDLD